MKERDYFIEACFSDDLQQFYEDWIAEKRDRAQFFNGLSHKYWMPSRLCCDSGEELTRDNIAIKVGYWTPNAWKPIREDLLKEAKKKEAYECQLIDMSCNDCLYLDRSKGWCKKLNKKASVWVGVCNPNNADCFEHRLDG